jgi:hypothetical protein
MAHRRWHECGFLFLGLRNPQKQEGLTSAWRATADPLRVRMISRNYNPSPASSARPRSAVPHA